jgi:TonB family protein
VTFDVERVWKGSAGMRTTIYRRIPLADGASEFHPILFERFQPYVVTAHRLAAAEQTELGLEDKEVLGTNMCGGGSRPLAVAQEELRTLGRGHPPRPSAIWNPRFGRPIRKVHDARAVWPEAAKEAGVRGNVIVEFVIDTDGSVTDIRILRGIPLLNEAALECVRQWQYEPVHLNGRAIPVLMTAVVPVP